MSFSMDQAKNWYRWATDKKRIARASGAPGPVFRTMGRRGLVGNAGQATAEEIAQAVYEEDLAREEKERQRRNKEYSNARANGYSPSMMTSSRTRRAPAQVNSNRASMASNLPMQFVQAGIFGGKSRRRRSHKRSRRASTRRHR
jgi:hypothetical protein